MMVESAGRRAAKWSPITIGEGQSCIHRNRRTMHSSFHGQNVQWHGSLALSVPHDLIMTKSHNMAAIGAAMPCQRYQLTSVVLDIHVMVN